MQDLSKLYEFKLKWGSSTDTDDSTGLVLSTSTTRPTIENINDILPVFLGNYKQVPPQYSAIKINGIRSYKLARQRKFVDHKPRIVKIYDLKCSYINSDYCSFEVICSKGTFVRSLARDLGEKLNTKAHVVELRRKLIGNFSVENAILLDLSKKLIHSPLILKNMIPLGEVMKVLPSLNLTEEEAYKIKNGQKLSLNNLKYFNKFLKKYPNYKILKNLYCCLNDLPVAFIKIYENEIRPSKVFNV